MSPRIGRLFDAGSWLLLFAGAMSVGTPCVPGDEISAPLPQGVKVVWDAARAVHEATATRERFCINGLWRWQPAGTSIEQPPAKSWGHFKVPGCWPGISDYMQKDSQTLYRHPDWKDVKLAALTAAWYEREIAIPDHWADRRIALSIEYLNSYAAVFVDGRPAGEVRFPGGEVELTAACRTGGRHRLSLLVLAMPLKAVMLSYNDTASARQVKGTVARRGLCGDVYLEATPVGPRIADVRVGTSVRNGQISFDAALQQLDAGAGIPSAPASPKTATPSPRSRASRSRARPRPGTHRVRRELEAGPALGPPHARQALCAQSFAARRPGPGPGYGPGQAIRGPRVLDRRSRLLPERDAHLPVRSSFR